MDFFTGLSIGLFVYLAFISQIAGFLSRDELRWRSLMFIASICYLIYYARVADEPLVDAIVTNSVLGAVNLVMIVIVVLERSTIGMSAEMHELYTHFPRLTPGQFRKLHRIGTRIECLGDESLAKLGAPPHYLYFIIKGPVIVRKSDVAVSIPPGEFIAEIAFLTGGTATASVTAENGAVLMRWNADRLRSTLAKSRSLDAAFVASLNIDLANKLAVSVPMQRDV